MLWYLAGHVGKWSVSRSVGPMRSLAIRLRGNDVTGVATTIGNAMSYAARHIAFLNGRPRQKEMSDCCRIEPQIHRLDSTNLQVSSRNQISGAGLKGQGGRVHCLAET